MQSSVELEVWVDPVRPSHAPFPPANCNAHTEILATQGSAHNIDERWYYLLIWE
jgi:hypothetical protein